MRHMQVAGAGDRVRLQHLGDVGQVRGDGGVPVPLADLQGDERCHAEADRGGRDLRAEAPDRAPRDQLVQPGLHRAPGHRAAAGSTRARRSAARRRAASISRASSASSWTSCAVIVAI